MSVITMWKVLARSLDRASRAEAAVSTSKSFISRTALRVNRIASSSSTKRMRRFMGKLQGTVAVGPGGEEVRLFGSYLNGVALIRLTTWQNTTLRTLDAGPARRTAR